MPIRHQAIIWSNAYYEHTSEELDAKIFFWKRKYIMKSRLQDVHHFM